VHSVNLGISSPRISNARRKCTSSGAQVCALVLILLYNEILTYIFPSVLFFKANRIRHVLHRHLLHLILHIRPLQLSIPPLCPSPHLTNSLPIIILLQSKSHTFPFLSPTSQSNNTLSPHRSSSPSLNQPPSPQPSPSPSPPPSPSTSTSAPSLAPAPSSQTSPNYTNSSIAKFNVCFRDMDHGLWCYRELPDRRGQRMYSMRRICTRRRLMSSWLVRS